MAKQFNDPAKIKIAEENLVRTQDAIHISNYAKNGKIQNSINNETNKNFQQNNSIPNKQYQGISKEEMITLIDHIMGKDTTTDVEYLYEIIEKNWGIPRLAFESMIRKGAYEYMIDNQKKN